MPVWGPRPIQSARKPSWWTLQASGSFPTGASATAVTARSPPLSARHQLVLCQRCESAAPSQFGRLSAAPPPVKEVILCAPAVVP